MNSHYRNLVLALAAFAAFATAVPADAGPGGYGGGYHQRGHGHGHGHGWGYRAPFWGGVGLGIGLGFGSYYYGAPVYRPGYYVQVPPVVYEAAPAPPAAPPQPDPVIYPNQGQSPEQTEADRQACDRWAMTQPGTMTHASIFHRATLACMEGRGYTVR